MEDQRTGAEGVACPVCGGLVPRQSGRGQPRRYCSSRCKSLAARRRRGQHANRPPEASPPSADERPEESRTLTRRAAIELVAADPAALNEALLRVRTMIVAPAGRASGWHEVAATLQGLAGSIPGDID